MDSWSIVDRKGKAVKKLEKDEKNKTEESQERSVPRTENTSADKLDNELARRLTTNEVSPAPRSSPKISAAAQKFLAEKKAKDSESSLASSPSESEEQREKRLNALIADAKREAMQWMAVKAGKDAQSVEEELNKKLDQVEEAAVKRGIEQDQRKKQLEEKLLKQIAKEEPEEPEEPEVEAEDDEEEAPAENEADGEAADVEEDTPAPAAVSSSSATEPIVIRIRSNRRGELPVEAEDGGGGDDGDPTPIEPLDWGQGLHTSQFLREHKIADLMGRFKVKTARHKTYPNLILFKYSQISSPFRFQVTRECRGLILDEEDDWRVVAFPYIKFFNLHERFAAKLDWSSVKVYEKLDGSLATMYFYDKKWHVSSSGLPDASGMMPLRETGESLPFAEIFWNIFKKKGYQLPHSRDEGTKCFVFEMIIAESPILVPYTEDRLVLHGVRNLSPPFKEEEPDSFAKAYKWELIQKYPLHSLEEVLALSKKLSPMTSEGFVCCDKNFERVKIKCPQYVSMLHMNSRRFGKDDPANTRAMLAIVMANEGDEFLAYFPKSSWLFKDVLSRYDQLCVELIRDLKGETKLARALPAERIALVQRLRDAKVTPDTSSVREYLSEVALDTIMAILPPSFSHKSGHDAPQSHKAPTSSSSSSSGKHQKGQKGPHKDFEEELKKAKAEIAEEEAKKKTKGKSGKKPTIPQPKSASKKKKKKISKTGTGKHKTHICRATS